MGLPAAEGGMALQGQREDWRWAGGAFLQERREALQSTGGVGPWDPRVSRYLFCCLRPLVSAPLVGELLHLHSALVRSLLRLHRSSEFWNVLSPEPPVPASWVQGCAVDASCSLSLCRIWTLHLRPPERLRAGPVPRLSLRQA